MERKLLDLVILLAMAAAWFIFPGMAGAQAQQPEHQGNYSFEPGDRDSELKTMDSMFSLYQPYLENISAYKPMYFLVGAEPEESKFQISLKYRFFNPEKAIARKYPWSRQFFLGYTQTSFWDLNSASQPFKDTSYKPEIFFFSHNLLNGGDLTPRVFVQTGLQHESNGQGGDESRSTNYVYIRPSFIWFHEKSGLGIQVAPRIWAYAGNDDDTNRDLYRYRGYFDIEIKAGRAEGFVLGSHFRWAEKGASLHLDATYPLHSLLPVDIDVYLHAQYVNALAESLLDFRERVRAVRFGFSIVR